MARDDEPWWLQAVKRRYHLGGAVPDQRSPARRIAPDIIVDRWVRRSFDRNRRSAALSRTGRLARSFRDVVLRVQCWDGDHDCLRASLLLRRPAKLLPATHRYAAA